MCTQYCNSTTWTASNEFKKLKAVYIKLCVKRMHTINIELIYQEMTLYETQNYISSSYFSNKFDALVLVALRMLRTFDGGVV